MDLRHPRGRFGRLAGAAVLAPAVLAPAALALLASAGPAAAAPAALHTLHAPAGLAGHAPARVTAQTCMKGGGSIGRIDSGVWICLGGRYGGSTVSDL